MAEQKNQNPGQTNQNDQQNQGGQRHFQETARPQAVWSTTPECSSGAEARRLQCRRLPIIAGASKLRPS